VQINQMERVGQHRVLAYIRSIMLGDLVRGTTDFKKWDVRKAGKDWGKRPVL
jgi:hypothetical protein